MIEPSAEFPEGGVARRMLDRSEQAARFLDLTRQRGLEPDDDDEDLALPLSATLMRDVVSAAGSTPSRDDVDEPDPDVLDANGLDVDETDDIRIDHAAWGAFRPGSVPRGDGIGRFTLDDDGDVFGDGNGFGSDAPIGARPDDSPF